MKALALVPLALVALALAPAHAAPPAGIDELYPTLFDLYVDLHQHPELSRHEAATAAKLADRLQALGFEVTRGVGGHGVVALMKNGKGPTVMLRTDLDALPVTENTGLAYASKITTTDDSGASVGVMHACGHDVHMAAWVGAATVLAKAKGRWHGTLVMLGQPAEEQGAGARAMLADGLFTRFPKPDYALMIHDDANLPAGKIGWVSGFAAANVDSIDLTIFGRGGHGAYPHNAIDPIVIAARTVVALQTVVARENNPLDPAVVTVGSIHGGTKHNIIPDEVKLQITVRSYKDEVRKRLLESIARIVKGEAAAAGAPKEPLMLVSSDSTSAVYNDPKLTKRLVDVLAKQLGATRLEERPPVMGAEDFSEYGKAGVAATFFWIGAVEPKKFAAAKAAGTPLPSNHSPLFAPEPEPTIKTAVTTLVLSALELFGK